MYSHLTSRLFTSSLSKWSWKTPRARPIWGVNTQLSASNSNTDWTTALKKNMNTRGLDPSLINILNILCHTIRAFKRFWTTAGQSSYYANITLPRYLKDFTILRGRPYTLNSLEVIDLASSTNNHNCFHSTPFVHWSVQLSEQFGDFHITRISQKGYCGWRRLPSSSITTVYWAFLYQRCNLMAVRVADWSLYPSNGQLIGPTLVENSIW